MTFRDSIAKCFGVYNTLLAGRASRSEFWWFMLSLLIPYAIIMILLVAMVPMIDESGDIAAGGLLLLPVIFIVYFAVILYMMVASIPAIAVLVRRLHDTDRSGWWYWISIIPFVGIIVLFVFLVQRGTEGPNRFGGDPLDPGAGGGYGGEGLTRSSIPSVPRDY